MRTGRPPGYGPVETLEVEARYADGRAKAVRGAHGPCDVPPQAPSENGYVYVSVGGGVKVQAHRLAWEEANGPIPEGLEPDHKCGVKACRNVGHLELVTRGENVRRAFDAPTCGRGHVWTPATTVRRRNGTRTCRVCMNERQKRRYHERKGTA